MAFGRKSPEVATAMDREELAALLDRFEKATQELKTATWEMAQGTAKAARVMQDLKKAVAEANVSARKVIAAQKRPHS